MKSHIKYTPNLFGFLFINFIVAIFSDILLNDFSRPPASNFFSSQIIQSLQPYFANKSILQAGIYAGITIIIAVIITLMIHRTLYSWWNGNGLYNLGTSSSSSNNNNNNNNYNIFTLSNLSTPTTWREITQISAIAFVVGYILDVAIDKMGLFGSSLEPYYDIAGSGYWGSFALIFSLLISFILQKYLVPRL